MRLRGSQTRSVPTWPSGRTHARVLHPLVDLLTPVAAVQPPCIHEKTRRSACSCHSQALMHGKWPSNCQNCDRHQNCARTLCDAITFTRFCNQCLFEPMTVDVTDQDSKFGQTRAPQHSMAPSCDPFDSPLRVISKAHCNSLPVQHS